MNCRVTELEFHLCVLPRIGEKNVIDCVAIGVVRSIYTIKYQMYPIRSYLITPNVLPTQMDAYEKKIGRQH